MSAAKNDWITLTRECVYCRAQVDIKVRKKDADEFYNSKRRRLIQHIFPYLTEGDREMFISGICPVCWDEMFAKEECVMELI